MNLNQYLESVRRGVENATALADDNTQEIAHRLVASIDDATRLALIEAISDATAEISGELAPGSVEVRLNGGQPQFVVTKPAQEEPVDPEAYAAAYAQTDVMGNDHNDRSDRTALIEDDDEPTARISFRVPASIKSKIDDAAEQDGLSSNAWLLRTVMRSLEPGGSRRFGPPTPPGPPGSAGPGSFGLGGAFGPGSPFNPENLFGPGGLLEGKIPGFGGDSGGRGRKGNGQRMQGWAQ